MGGYVTAYKRLVRKNFKYKRATITVIRRQKGSANDYLCRVQRGRAPLDDGSFAKKGEIIVLPRSILAELSEVLTLGARRL